MSASRLDRFFRLLNYKHLIYFCITIAFVQFYLGFTFYANPEKKRDRLLSPDSHIDSQDLHSSRQNLYRKSFQVHGIGAVENDIVRVSRSRGQLLNSSSAWNPDKLRKNIIDDLLTKHPVKCEGSMNADAVSAVNRAKTDDCKEAIRRVSCLLEHKKLFPSTLPRYCPLKGQGRGKYMGCYKDDPLERDLTGAKHKSTENSPVYCTNMCLTSGYKYAGVQFGEECWCGDSYGKHGLEVPTGCDYPCPSNSSLVCGGFNAIAVYNTGYGSRPDGTQLMGVVPAVLDVETSHMVRILFMFTWNGRAWRQVMRLFKQVYHVNHYYYIHVDSRQEYLYRQVLALTRTYDNVRVVSRRIATIWGGSSLLQMLLHTMREALDMKDWAWDFYLNLSESDYPVKSLEELTAFLTENKGKNFLKSHGPNTPIFLRKQGLTRTFYECDYHLWRVGNRTVPTGIRVDGGSDWICLSRNFVEYVTSSQDELVQGLRQYFTYALLPAESYFHTVLQNSEYCETFIDNNLHKTNWNRKRGCLCQHKNVVDWCGCSPMDFIDSPIDKDNLKKTAELQIFFARKFEAVVSTRIVNWVDEWLHSAYPEGTQALTTYWQNVFHEGDSWRKAEDSPFTYYMSFVRNTIRKLVKVNNAEHCNVDVTAIKQVHLLTQMDVFDGLLVDFSGRHKEGPPVDWEIHLKPRDRFVLIKPFGAISRITQLQVGSIYDIKERMFRDYGQLLGSHTPNVTVVQLWQGGMAVDVTIVITDPLGRVAYVHNITVPQGMDNLVITKVDLRKPMLPGQWDTKLVYQNVLVAKASFLVLPELYTERKFQFSASNIYSFLPYDLSFPDETIQSYKHIVDADEDKQYTSEEKLRGILNSGPQSVLEWADKLVDAFWKPNAACAINDPIICDLIPQCNGTSWSSYIPDPKSDHGPINPRTGKISQVIDKS